MEIFSPKLSIIFDLLLLFSILLYVYLLFKAIYRITNLNIEMIQKFILLFVILAFPILGLIALNLSSFSKKEVIRRY